MLLQGGAVKCWGNNKYGQIGAGSLDTQPEPVDVLEGPAAAIATGNAHSCAAMESGEVLYWGGIKYGYQSYEGPHVPTPTPPWRSGVVKLAGGMFTIYGVLATGGLQFIDAMSSSGMTRVAVAGMDTGVEAITAQGMNVCALVEPGAVKCWGYDLLGSVTGANRPHFTPVCSGD